jgi:uncharacterized protein DUF4124
MNPYLYAMGTLVLGLVWLSSSASETLAQEIYRWTDKDGKTHFSNIAPKASEGASSTTRAPAEAPDSEPAPAPSVDGPAAVKPPEESSETGKHAELSEDAFSNQVSGTRLRLKRELQQTKERSREAADKLEALKKERDQPARVGLEILQKAYGPDRHESSEEQELLKEKQRAEKRVEEIRKEYAELRDEAVKRFGRQPSWWLPID